MFIRSVLGGYKLISHICIGSNDIDTSRRFYSTLLTPLGYDLVIEKNGDLSYTLGSKNATVTKLPDFYVKNS